eukprot:3011340-Pyramimonas_sp.AAC.1
MRSARNKEDNSVENAPLGRQEAGNARRPGPTARNIDDSAAVTWAPNSKRPFGNRRAEGGADEALRDAPAAPAGLH